MSAKSAPRKMGAAEIIAYANIGVDHHRADKVRHLVGGRQLGSAAGLAIGHYPGERGYFLFYCDGDWNPMTNTWHETVDDAKQAAEFEYEGVSKSWQSAA